MLEHCQHMCVCSSESCDAPQHSRQELELPALNMCVTLLGSISLSGTFFCVTTATLSFPRTPMLVMPEDLTALKAYSASDQQCSVSSLCLLHAALSYMYILAHLEKYKSACKCPFCKRCRRLTNLEKASLGAEDGDVPIIASATAA